MSNPYKGRTGIDRIGRALGYSLAGLRAAYISESAFRQEILLLVIATPLAFWLGQDWVQIALLLGSLIGVLIVELLNSGIEAAIDRVSFDLHDLSKRAKDLASAAVLLSLLLSGGIWIAAAWQKIA